ncbi:MAG: DUF3429 domain-containing protein [Hyphomicrobiaceae bacterium]
MPPNVTTSHDEIPRPALLLGLGGLIPFVALTAASWVLDRTLADFATRALVAYSAIILSFMGGVHWGVATVYSAPTAMTAAPVAGPSTRLFLVSVLPALAAWPAALLAPSLAFAAFAATFLALLAFDLSVVRSGVMPKWYGRLRVMLTSVVVVCLVAAAVEGLH